jgi:hypothetical protein
MKFVSVLLMGTILFLSLFAGMAKPVVKTSEKMCCKRMTDRSACKRNKPPGGDNDCNKTGCNMMLTCSICGFLAVAPLTIGPVSAPFSKKPVSLYKIGDLSTYSSSYWKPPKVC